MSVYSLLQFSFAIAVCILSSFSKSLWKLGSRTAYSISLSSLVITDYAVLPFPYSYCFPLNLSQELYHAFLPSVETSCFQDTVPVAIGTDPTETLQVFSIAGILVKVLLQTTCLFEKRTVITKPFSPLYAATFILFTLLTAELLTILSNEVSGICYVGFFRVFWWFFWFVFFFLVFLCVCFFVGFFFNKNLSNDVFSAINSCCVIPLVISQIPQIIYWDFN